MMLLVKLLFANNPVVGGVNTATGVEVGPGGTPVVEGIQILVNGPQEDLLSVEEWTSPWKEANEQRDPAVSYVPFASLGRTGYILENRAGEAYCRCIYSVRDFDRFNYWESDDVEIDFGTPSLGYDYIYEWVNSYVPFSACSDIILLQEIKSKCMLGTGITIVTSIGKLQSEVDIGLDLFTVRQAGNQSTLL